MGVRAYEHTTRPYCVRPLYYSSSILSFPPVAAVAPAPAPVTTKIATIAFAQSSLPLARAVADLGEGWEYPARESELRVPVGVIPIDVVPDTRHQTPISTHR